MTAFDYKAMWEDLMAWIYDNPLLDPVSRDMVVQQMIHIEYSRIPYRSPDDITT